MNHLYERMGLFGDTGSSGDESGQEILNILLYLLMALATLYVLMRIGDRNNRFDYKDRITQIIAGYLMLYSRIHTRAELCDFTHPEEAAASPSEPTLKLLSDDDKASPEADTHLALVPANPQSKPKLFRRATDHAQLQQIAFAASQLPKSPSPSLSPDKALIPSKALIAAGPHKLGFAEALSLAACLDGVPISYMATDTFNKIYGVGSFMARFGTLFVKFSSPEERRRTGSSSNVIEVATKAFTERENFRLGIFPQGNFCNIGALPHIVYNGTALIAIKSRMPIHVVRLDGYWSLQNPLLPTALKNNSLYRAFLSGLHMNNIRPKLTCVIDYHLKPENKGKPDSELIRQINAQLYAYFRETKELSAKDITRIQEEISSGKHLEIWDARYQLYLADKKYSKLLADKTEEPKAAEETGAEKPATAPAPSF